MIEEILLYTIIAIFIGISQAAGIGGGPILNICLMLGQGLSARASMNITYIFLMGGSVSSIISNYNKKHPTMDRLVMDYNLILVTLPMTASGALFGTIINHFVSELAITILFTILLGYLSYDTLYKLKYQNNLSQLQTKTPLLDKTSTIQQFQMKEICLQSIQDNAQTHFNSQKKENQQLQKFREEDNNPLPTDKLKIAGIIFVYTFIVLVTKGDSNFQSIIGIRGCSVGTYIIIFLHLALSLLASKSVIRKIQKTQLEKANLGFNILEEEKMTSQKAFNSMLSGFAAGIIGGALGLGGAIILVPVWLSTGVQKIVATSSSGPLIFFSALISFIMAFLQGNYNENYPILVFYFGLAFFGAWTIKKFINYIVEKYQLKQMIFILLLIRMVSSLLVLLPFQLYRFLQNSEKFIQFGHLC